MGSLSNCLLYIWRHFMKNHFYAAWGAFWLLTTPAYAQEKEIFVEKVTNSVVIGPVAGNRGLEFVLQTFF